MKQVVWLLLAGAVATSIGVVVADRYAEHFQIPLELQKYNPPYADEIADRIVAAEDHAARSNAAMIGGVVGALLAGCFGAAAAIAGGRSFLRSIGGLVGGGLIGVALGALGGVGNRLVFEQLSRNGTDIFQVTLASHAVLWLSIAVAVAVSVRFGVGEARASMLHVGSVLLTCAAIVATLYPFVAAILFPLQRSDQPVPEGAGNLSLWIGLPALLFALASGRILASAIHHGESDASELASAPEATSPEPAG